MPSLDSLYQRRASQWPAYYAIIEQQLGATASLLNFGNQRTAGLVSAATFTGRKFNASGLAPVWTPNEALSAWDTPFDLTVESNWQGLAPILASNGTDEYASTPDDTYFSRGDGANDAAMSVGAWLNGAFGTAGSVLSKWEATGTQFEWQFSFVTAGQIGLIVRDASAAVNAQRVADASAVLNVWHLFVVTYDGTGGADAMGTSGSVQDNCTVYVDGAIVASTATDNASYVAMENGTAVVEFMRRDGTIYHVDKCLGGPWSPFFVQAELTPAQVSNIYQNMRLGLGV